MRVFNLILLLLCFSLQPEFNSYALAVQQDEDIVIQIGAFHVQSNAIALKERMWVVVDKSVSVEFENGYYKVRFADIPDAEHADMIITRLRLAGIRDIWLVPSKKKKETGDDNLSVTDSILNTNENDQPLADQGSPDSRPDSVNAEPVLINPVIALQIGVYQQRSKASRVKDKITAKISRPVEVVKKYNYYQVIMTGFSTTEEAIKIYPSLQELGYNEISLIQDYHK
jgi:hypothetical protein